ncbi:peptidase E [Kineosporia sp. NBRC 101677]|uniref:dipeptidase PepE n=1 Tax=Kineosporia sp. NBRC 101677 TaxID=3032197 RepID=UPI0024A5CCB5|nr:dipeptidase PepE [Kineosporia sp. NBRC 101677]GLY19807.1 peptidase E [Kineosporia sp. NBRC 101677]
MELLLLSNSTNHGGRPWAHAASELAEFAAGADTGAGVFVPYALADHDAYTEAVAKPFAAAGVELTGVHTAEDPVAAVAAARFIVVGGGNTFRLLRALQRSGLIEPLRQAVAGGARYVGASAGTNITAPTIRTTNDMPIVEPDSFRALELVPFQINPHYVDADPDSRHMGETRETRLREFGEENDVAVLGLREGTYLRVSGDTAKIGGKAVSAHAPGPAILFRRGGEPEEISGDVSGLLSFPAEFDVPEELPA